MKATVGIVIGMLLVAGSIASAQPEPADGKGRARMGQGGNPEAMMMEHLKLTDQQKTDLHKLRADMERSMVKTQSAIHLARIDLRQLAAADKLDRGAIEKKVKEISELQQQAKSALIDHLFAVYAMLTPEQQKMFKEHMAQRLEGEMGQGMGPGMGHEMMRRPGRGGARAPMHMHDQD